MEKPINIILVGDTYVGKSCLLASYAQQRFPLDYQPTVFDQFTAQIQKKEGLEKLDLTLNLMDPSGQKDQKALR